MSRGEQESGLEIVRIELLESSYNSPDHYEGGIVEFNHEISVSFKKNLDDNTRTSQVVIISSSKEARLVSAKLKILYVFKVKKGILDTESTEVHKDIVKKLNRIVLSSSRGVMATVLKGTFFHSAAVLPIIEEAELEDYYVIYFRIKMNDC